jgi:hypothetical protein
MTVLMTLGLTGGVAAADNRHSDARGDEIRDHRATEARVDHLRDRGHPPAARFERHEDRRGFRWIGGEWRWSGSSWTWAPGHYVRAARW